MTYKKKKKKRINPQREAGLQIFRPPLGFAEGPSLCACRMCGLPRPSKLCLLPSAVLTVSLLSPVALFLPLNSLTGRENEPSGDP